MEMKHLITLLALLNITLFLHAEECLDSLYTRLGLDSCIKSVDCDTIVDCNGYSVRVVKNNGQLKTLGLSLFSDNIKENSDKEVLCFIESALLAQTRGILNAPFNKVILKSGNFADFKQIGPATDCSISAVNSKSMNIDWTVSGKKVCVESPLGYDAVKTGNRSQIENALIAKLKKGGLLQHHSENLDTVRLEPYKEDLYIYPGNTYLNKDISSTIYLHSGETLTPVWNTKYPLESIANLFLYPSSIYGNPQIELKILKHEYGESEIFTIPVADFLTVTESEGCSPYWGVESFEGGNLKGALFLFNRHQGYEHVISVECNPEELIAGKGSIKARASLYIPTNNVDNLFQPYVKKSKDEKIKYNK
ncbi:hypothetical protein [Bacteroides acidifaciens]|uniref:hypothetical protein n=1 Tax=Bacteroides acidifaciens TaxID=85831 RepID=UPI0026EA344C|nr:hypothetical protein [Bacteroides acidifaciens]